MFNAEKLLGKLVGDLTHTGGSWGKNKKKHSPLNALTSGSGLMTLIGLGVGAYEILKQQGQQQAAGSGPVPPPQPGSTGQAVPPPPPPAGGGMQAPPAPTVSAATSPNPPAPVAATATIPVAAAAPSGQGQTDLAVRLIQVMVAAAHADGVMDEQEERAVLDKLRGVDLTQEEKMFLLGELHQPKSIEQLVEGVVDPGVGRTMYMLAVAAAKIDTEAERAWFDQLAGRLGLSKEIQAFIEEQY